MVGGFKSSLIDSDGDYLVGRTRGLESPSSAVVLLLQLRVTESFHLHSRIFLYFYLLYNSSAKYFMVVSAMSGIKFQSSEREASILSMFSPLFPFKRFSYKVLEPFLPARRASDAR